MRTRTCRRSLWPRTTRRSRCRSASSVRTVERGRTSRMHLTRRRRQASHELSCLLRERQPSWASVHGHGHASISPSTYRFFLTGSSRAGDGFDGPAAGASGDAGDTSTSSASELIVGGRERLCGRTGRARREPRGFRARVIWLFERVGRSQHTQAAGRAHGADHGSNSRREQVESRSSVLPGSPPTAQMASTLSPTPADHNLRARRQDRPDSRNLGRRSQLLVLCTKLTCARYRLSRSCTSGRSRESRSSKGRPGSPRAACSRVRAPWTPWLRDCD